MWTAEEKLCPPLSLPAEPCAGWSTCWGRGSVSTITTPSWSHSAESPVAKEHEGPPRADTESPSGAQRVKNVSSSNREYSELRGLWLLALCCCVLGLAGVLVSGTLSWTVTMLLGSCDVTGVDWGAADWGEGRRGVCEQRRDVLKTGVKDYRTDWTFGEICFLTFLQRVKKIDTTLRPFTGL